MRIEPTVGRIVWYYPEGVQPMTQPLAAIVTHVNADDRINLAIASSTGVMFPKVDVFLAQEGVVPPTGEGHAVWMPYQVGQAKKNS